MEEGIDLFMISKSLKNCVMVLPQREVTRLMEDAAKLEPIPRANFRDMLGSGLRKVKMDQAGRVSIPDDFLDLLRLPENKEVWLTGSIDAFNIWSVPDFEEHKASERMGVEEAKRNLGI